MYPDNIFYAGCMSYKKWPHDFLHIFLNLWLTEKMLVVITRTTATQVIPRSALPLAPDKNDGWDMNREFLTNEVTALPTVPQRDPVGKKIAQSNLFRLIFFL